MEVQYVFNESFPASVRLQLGELRCFLVRKSAEDLFSTKNFYFYFGLFFPCWYAEMPSWACKLLGLGLSLQTHA